MNREALIQQLISVRAAIEAALLLLQEPEAEPEPPGCQHPPAQRMDLSTMGHPRWQCKQCGHVEEVTT